MKKCFLFIPAGAMLFSLLTGCSSANSQPVSSTENPVSSEHKSSSGSTQPESSAENTVSSEHESSSGSTQPVSSTENPVSSEPESKPENKAGTIKFDFENGDEAFVSIFADYPCSDGTEEFYEPKHSLEDNPVKGNGKSLFISGNNHSDDLFMGYYKRLDGFDAGEKYVFSVKFEIATDVSGNMMGVGGAPGESVFVKCGLTSVEPKKVVKDDANYRLNIDAGVQGNGGKDMIVVGNIAKQDEQNFNGYDINRYELDFSAITDENGSVFLVIGTDSGFEATTHYFIDNIELSWKKSE